LTSYLQVRGFGVVDNRRSGGVLWVVDKPALEPVIDELRDQGIELEYAGTGGLATNYRPTWWTRTWGGGRGAHWQTGEIQRAHEPGSGGQPA
jgi:hypothetical protein